MHPDTADEDAAIAGLGGRRATCSPRGLLTSHCIVLCHYTLDVVEARAALAAVASGPEKLV
jgi:tRNA pseudouridine-54 N-methylase